MLPRNPTLLALWIVGVVCFTGKAAGSLPDKTEDAMALGFQPLPAATFSTVQQLLLSHIRQRQVPAPAGVMCETCLFRGWHQRSGSGHGRRFAVSSLQAAMADYPAQVVDKLRVLLFASSGSTTFENFSVDIQQTHAVKHSFYGLARRLNDVVEVAIVSANISANLVQKYITLQRRVCKKFIGIKISCKTVSHTEPRGYHANEIEDMTATLMSETFRIFAEYAAHMTD